MIQTWLAGKLSGIIIFCIACAAVPLAIIAGVQTVRLDGISVLGWHIVDGAIHGREVAEGQRDKALKDLGICRANNGVLTTALNESNASIRQLHEESAAATAAAQQLLDAETSKRVSLQKRLQRIAEAHIDTSSPGAAAISIDSLIRESVQ